MNISQKEFFIDFSSFALIAVIFSLNLVIEVIVVHFSKFEKHRTYSKSQISIAKKISFVRKNLLKFKK